MAAKPPDENWTRRARVRSPDAIPTLKETPAEAEVASHQLMMRAGMIRKVAAGIYSLLPLGVRVLRNVERIVREELDAAGAQEVELPVVIPAELWQESGRWDLYGKELLRIRDRHRDFCPGPTHEKDHRHRAPRCALLPAASAEPLPDPHEVPGRDPPALRPHARARVLHDGRLLVPRRGGRPRPRVRRDARGLHADLRSLRPHPRGGGGRHGRDRWEGLPRVHGARRLLRGRRRDLRRLRLRGQRREGGGAGSRPRGARGRRRPRAGRGRADARAQDGRGGVRLPGGARGALHQDARVPGGRRARDGLIRAISR
jgi:hypothetical protein